MRKGRKIAMGFGRSSTGENTIWNSGDIYDENKQPTGRTMKRNDWHMKPDEFHLTVLGVIARPDGTFLITKRVMTKACGHRLGGRFPAARHRQERARWRPCAVRSERKPDSM